MRKVLVVLALASLFGCQTKNFVPGAETADQHDERMEWWREARFGMFIHWGLYAVPAGEYGEGRNHAEWIRTTAQIPLDEYDQYRNDFNPTKYNADDWVSMAKQAGMKYIVITSKHHDGFCLWDSKETDFDIMSTPYERDLLKQLAKACKKQDIKLCFYHSIMDWQHPDYLPRRGWEKNRSSEGADFSLYVDYMKKQLEELLTEFGDIGVLWFDGEWESTWTADQGTDLYNYVRSLQPDIIINNRVSVGRAGMEGLTKEGGFAGDFGTPEQQIPATGLPDTDWETCMTMNGHWGFNKYDKNFKSNEDLIQKLADIASKGGNFLLNIGPTAEGLFPQESIDRLETMGEWMDKNQESIYATKASPFENLAWGRCTQKAMDENTRLYLHVFEWPENGVLSVPGLANESVRAYLLADQDKNELNISKDSGGILIQLQENQPDQYNSVVVLDIVGEPIVYLPPKVSSPSTSFTQSTTVSIDAVQDKVEVRYTTDGQEPSSNSEKYIGEIRVEESLLVKAACFVDDIRVSGSSSLQLNKVSPLKAHSLSSIPSMGWMAKYYEGEYSSVADLSKAKPVRTEIITDLSLANNPADENFGMVISGYFMAPKAGAYQISLTADDGATLKIGKDFIIDNDGMHAAIKKSGIIALEKGCHKIEIRYFERTGGNTLKVEWRDESGKIGTMDRTVMYH